MIKFVLIQTIIFCPDLDRYNCNVEIVTSHEHGPQTTKQPNCNVDAGSGEEKPSQQIDLIEVLS